VFVFWGIKFRGVTCVYVTMQNFRDFKDEGQ
jgi:hypothetical protein